MTRDALLRDEVRTYYGTVGQYMEQELRQREDRAFWKELASGLSGNAGDGPGGGAAILDLGCGDGRITEILAVEGVRVLGMDLSLEMLLRARERTRDRPGVSLVQADMRTFRSTRRFDLIVAANDPFTHLVGDEDRDRALATVALHLARPGGRFVLDGFWLGEEKLLKAASAEGYRRERTIPPSDGRGGNGNEGSGGGGTGPGRGGTGPGGSGTGPDSGHEPGLLIRESWQCDTSTRRCRATFEYLRNGEVADEASFACRIWSTDEVRARLERAGLTLYRTLGGFDGRPFDPDDAAHLIVEAGPSTHF